MNIQPIHYPVSGPSVKSTNEDESCMVWDFLICACTTVSNIVLEIVGGQAGRWGRQDRDAY